MARRRFPGSIIFDPQDIIAEADQVISAANSLARECERCVRELEMSLPRIWDIPRFPPVDLTVVDNFANAIERELQDDLVPRGRNTRRVSQRNTRNHRQHSCQRATPRWHSSGMEDTPQDSSRNQTNDESNGSEICAVCQEDLKRPNQKKWILPCAHKFHVQCLRRWLNQNRTCPVCRHYVSFEDY